MTGRPRAFLASSSVALIAGVNASAAALGPDQARPVLLLCGGIALAFAVQSAAWNPGVVTRALLFSLLPVIALLAGDSPAWLIGPLGTLLLVACELNTLSWEWRDTGPLNALVRRRLLNIGQLGALGLAASLAIGVVASGPSPGGAAGVVVAAIALAGLGRVTFGRGR